MANEELTAALAGSQELPPEDLGIPGHIAEWVEREYSAWLKNPAWRYVTLPTEDVTEETVALARKYLRYGRAAGRLTLQVKKGYPRKVKGRFQLAYRVRDPIQRQRENPGPAGLAS